MKGIQTQNSEYVLCVKSSFVQLLHQAFTLCPFVFQDIANAWKGLEFAEKGFEEWLLSELQR